jgi:uncharacterized protein YdbL (DUF1318 family)
MKKLLFSTFIFILTINIQAQSDRSDILQDLEQSQISNQYNNPSATLKSSTRLFGSKNDLTTVLQIIPSGSTLEVLDADSTYLYVVYDKTEGYIFRRHAVIEVPSPQPQQEPVQVEEEQQIKYREVQPKKNSRFSYLENKYGSNMAARLMAGKIWKGMNSEMVKDSWGTSQKINRVVSGNTIKEEWIFKYSWLYFENNMLVEWGPLKN